MYSFCYLDIDECEQGIDECRSDLVVLSNEKENVYFLDLDIRVKMYLEHTGN